MAWIGWDRPEWGDGTEWDRMEKGNMFELEEDF